MTNPCQGVLYAWRNGFIEGKRNRTSCYSSINLAISAKRRGITFRPRSATQLVEPAKSKSQDGQVPGGKVRLSIHISGNPGGRNGSLQHSRKACLQEFQNATFSRVLNNSLTL